MADKPKDPKEWREWARAKLEELANNADEDKNRISAAIGLLRSLDAELAPLSRAADASPASPAQPKSRAYLEALAQEISSELESLDKKSH